jgi:putative flippase GtrA
MVITALSAIKRILTQAQLGKFMVVGGAGFLADAALTVSLVHLAGISPLPGRAISFVVLWVLCWQANRRWTFGVTKPHTVLEGLRYFGVNLVALSVNAWVYMTVVQAASFGMIATVIAVAAGTLAGLCINYTGLRLWVFRTGQQVAASQGTDL